MCSAHTHTHPALSISKEAVKTFYFLPNIWHELLSFSGAAAFYFFLSPLKNNNTAFVIRLNQFCFYGLFILCFFMILNRKKPYIPLKKRRSKKTETEFFLRQNDSSGHLLAFCLHLRSVSWSAQLWAFSVSLSLPFFFCSHLSQ